MIDPLARIDALRLAAGAASATRETLAEETPVALLYNGVPHVVMMATPLDLEDFAFGFSLTEGIVSAAGELHLVDVLPRENGLAVHLAISSSRFEALQARRRSLVGRTGCGLCGAEALDTAVRPVRRVEAPVRITAHALAQAFAHLAASQPLNRQCGALHAAAAVTRAQSNGDTSRRAAEENPPAPGTAALHDARRAQAVAERASVGASPTFATWCVREDVGRHNALDKVIGALARHGMSTDALLVTSRASYELVHKAAEAGVPVLAAVSAPTAYAVRLAQQAGLTLVAFAREDRMTVYAGSLASAGE